jgi:hypothetical protein
VLRHDRFVIKCVTNVLNMAAMFTIVNGKSNAYDGKSIASACIG